MNLKIITVRQFQLFDWLRGAQLIINWMTLHGKDNGRFFIVSLLYLQILSLSISKNVRYYWKSCLRGRRNWALKVLFQVCILKKLNYAHINSLVRTCE